MTRLILKTTCGTSDSYPDIAILTLSDEDIQKIRDYADIVKSLRVYCISEFCYQVDFWSAEWEEIEEWEETQGITTYLDNDEFEFTTLCNPAYSQDDEYYSEPWRVDAPLLHICDDYFYFTACLKYSSAEVETDPVYLTKL